MRKQKTFNWARRDWIGLSPAAVINGEKVPSSVAIAKRAPSGKHSFEHIYFGSRKDARAMYLKLKDYSDYLAQEMYECGHGDAIGAVRACLDPGKE